MDNDKLIEMLTSINERLGMLITSQNDHETRIRELEKTDLGRIIPFVVGVLTVISLAISIIVAIG